MHMTKAADGGRIAALVPGVILSCLVALAATALATLAAPYFALPSMVVALLIGIALHRVAIGAAFGPGIMFSGKTLLRWAVALLGLRVAVGDIVELGFDAAVLVMVAMTATFVAGVWIARILGQSASYGALAGVATAVCGASAALATSTALPDYRGKEAEIAFVVVAVNTLSTAAMVLYPIIAALLALPAQETGILLGATIHDVAQVVGAGYSVSEEVGNTAVVVKLFRVLLLFPIVVCIGYYFSFRQSAGGQGTAQIPGFAIAFILLCGLNSIAPGIDAIATQYASVRALLVDISSWGMLIAISALGLNTSLRSIAGLGWRHIVTVLFTSAIIFIVSLSGIFLLFG